MTRLKKKLRHGIQTQQTAQSLNLTQRTIEISKHKFQQQSQISPKIKNALSTPIKENFNKGVIVINLPGFVLHFLWKTVPVILSGDLITNLRT